jgi:fibronectin-binding autotransporter adhesin
MSAKAGLRLALAPQNFLFLMEKLMRLFTSKKQLLIWTGLASLLALLVLALPAHALGPYTWNGAGSDSNLMTDANWVGGLGPVDALTRVSGNNSSLNTDSSIVFAGSTRLDPYLSNWTDPNPPYSFWGACYYNGITFASSASPFVIGIDPLDTTGFILLGPTSSSATRTLQNLSTNVQTFTVAVGASVVNIMATSGDIVFNGDYYIAGSTTGRVHTVTGPGSVYFNAGIGLTSVGSDTTTAGILRLAGGTTYIAGPSDSTNLATSWGGYWNGRVEITNGVLRISDNHALGAGNDDVKLSTETSVDTITGRTTIGTAAANVGRLELANNITSSERLFITPRTATIAYDTAAAHIKNVGGNNTLTGPISTQTAAGSVVFDAASGSLTLGSATTPSTITAAFAGASTLVLRGGGTGVINDAITNGTGTWQVNKLDSGTWTLNGSNTYGGRTTVAGGTLKLGASGSLGSSTDFAFQNGAVLDVSALATPTVTASAVQGKGTVTGNLDLATLGGATLAFNLAATAADAGNDKITVSNDLNLGSGFFTVNLGFLGGSVQTGVPYTILTGGTLTSTSPSFSVFENTRYDFTTAVAGTSITVTASGGPAMDLTWSGTSGSDWDLIGTSNWNAGSEMFYELDRVAFNGGSAGTVNVTAVVRPGAIAIADSQDYEFSGTGSISGKPTFTKGGIGTLTISTANDFTSDLSVTGGTLQVKNAAALGSAAGKTKLSNGAVLDLFGYNLGNEPVVVESTSGKLFNGNPGISDGTVKYLTLNGDVTVDGGPAVGHQYAIVIAGVAGVTDNYLVGNGKKLTKLGTNFFYLNNLGETHLGNLDLQGGVTILKGNSTLGDQPGTVTVAGGASLDFTTVNQSYAKDITLADTAVLAAEGTASKPTLTGTVTLSGGTAGLLLWNDAILTISGDVAGSGGLTLANTLSYAGKLVLVGPKTYTGNTMVDTGSLALSGSGAIASPLITVNTTLDVLDGSHTVNAINSTGTGTVKVTAGNLTATSINVPTLTIGTPPAAAAVPEPATITLLLLAGLALAAFRRRVR